MDSSRSKCSKIQRDHELLMIEKSETIKELQERLEATQKRLAQNISETSSQSYVNIKAMHERFKMDQEKYANDLLTYQSELDELRSALKRKVIQWGLEYRTCSDFEWSTKFGFRMAFGFRMVKQDGCHFVRTMASLGRFIYIKILLYI